MTLDGTSGITQMTGSIVMSGSTSGTTTIIPSAVAGSNTATLPAATGTVMVSGNMPAFSVYQSSVQAISNSTNTKITFNTEFFDTANAFDSTTNYRFTPQVAGYYQFSLYVRDGTGAATGQLVAFIYKNGSILNFAAYTFAGAVGTTASCNALIYLNGSTDYIEGYVSQNSGLSMNTNNSSAATFFTGSLVRAA